MFSFPIPTFGSKKLISVRQTIEKEEKQWTTSKNESDQKNKFWFLIFFFSDQKKSVGFLQKWSFSPISSSRRVSSFTLKKTILANKTVPKIDDKIRHLPKFAQNLTQKIRNKSFALVEKDLFSEPTRLVLSQQDWSRLLKILPRNCVFIPWADSFSPDLIVTLEDTLLVFQMKTGDQKVSMLNLVDDIMKSPRGFKHVVFVLVASNLSSTLPNLVKK